MPYVVERKSEEEVYLDVPGWPRIPIKVLEARRGSTRLLIDAPPSVAITRGAKREQPPESDVLPMVNPNRVTERDHRQPRRAS